MMPDSASLRDGSSEAVAERSGVRLGQG